MLCSIFPPHKLVVFKKLILSNSEDLKSPYITASAFHVCQEKNCPAYIEIKTGQDINNGDETFRWIPSIKI